MTTTTPHAELISALADGQLDGEDFAQALLICDADTQAVTQWSAYHLIGDVLRSPGLAGPAADPAFVLRLRERLALEPAFDVTGSVASPAATALPAVPAVRPAANDASLRWKLVAGFASVAAVAAITWSAGSSLLLSPGGAQLAQSQSGAPVLVVSEQGTMLRDARMQELLAAHKQFGGTSALQMPSGFLRNATFETAPGERR